MTDVDGNVFLDFSAAFGVAVLGHAAPEVEVAVARQAGVLCHGMGDVHPPSVKVELAERLGRLFPGGGGKVLFGLSGSDAVEAAVKTAMVATGRPGAIAFEGAYHGLSMGALDCTHRDDFRAPFAERLARRTEFVPWPDAGTAEAVLRKVTGLAPRAGMVIVEPIQGRGGVRPLPAGFLARLRRICDDSGALLVLDEVLTGFGRTGRWFACQEEDVVPDLLCVGKALGGGLPLSALLGRAEVMDRWPASAGEAVHTSTFLGHPLASAAALAVLAAIESRGLVERAGRLGAHLAARLSNVGPVRGRGLFLGLEVGPGRGPKVMEAALRRGLVVLPAGPTGEVISITPPLVATEDELDAGADLLAEAVREGR